MKKHMNVAITSVTFHGSLPSIRMKATTKTGTVGIRPIRAIEIKNATIHPKNTIPRKRTVVGGR
jgi:hypothetical protein